MRTLAKEVSLKCDKVCTAVFTLLAALLRPLGSCSTSERRNSKSWDKKIRQNEAFFERTWDGNSLKLGVIVIFFPRWSLKDTPYTIHHGICFPDERSKRLHLGGINLNLNSQNAPSSEQISEVNWQIFWTKCHQTNHPILPILKYLKSTTKQSPCIFRRFPHPTSRPTSQPYLCYYIFQENSNPGGFNTGSSPDVKVSACEFSGKALKTHRPTWISCPIVLGDWKCTHTFVIVLVTQESVRQSVPCSTKPSNFLYLHGT